MIQPRPADELPALIRTALQTAGLSQAEASRHLGLSTKHLNQMLTGKAPITVPWAQRLLDLCGWRLMVALEHGPTDPPPESP